jgi:hypothetical protein
MRFEPGRNDRCFGRKRFLLDECWWPSLFLVLNKDLKIGVGALPSIYLLESRLGARLGVSPRIDYKNIVFIAPFFYRDKTDKWIWSVGLGYKFHKKKCLTKKINKH